MIQILGRARRQQSRRKQVIVIHTNEGPEQTHGAVNLATWLATKDFGYHEIVDPSDFVVTALDNETTNGARGGNAFSYHICGIGYAAQTGAQWADTYSRGELAVMEDRTAEACKRFGIGARFLTPQDVLEIRHGNTMITGICGHFTITAAARADGDLQASHTDPGTEFPWSQFIRGVQDLLHPLPPPPEDDLPYSEDQLTKIVLDALTVYFSRGEGQGRIEAALAEYFQKHPVK